MDFCTEITPADLVGITMIAESNQFAIYATGHDQYLLVQRHAARPWTGLLMSGDGVFRICGLLTDASRHLYREMAAQLSPGRTDATVFETRTFSSPAPGEPGAEGVERRDLYADDLTEERQISPVVREEIAGTLRLDPIDGTDQTGQPLTRRG